MGFAAAVCTHGVGVPCLRTAVHTCVRQRATLRPAASCQTGAPSLQHGTDNQVMNCYALGEEVYWSATRVGACLALEKSIDPMQWPIAALRHARALLLRLHPPQYLGAMKRHSPGASVYRAASTSA